MSLELLHGMVRATSCRQARPRSSSACGEVERREEQGGRIRIEDAMDRSRKVVGRREEKNS